MTKPLDHRRDGFSRNLNIPEFPNNAINYSATLELPGVAVIRRNQANNRDFPGCKRIRSAGILPSLPLQMVLRSKLITDTILSASEKLREAIRCSTNVRERSLRSRCAGTLQIPEEP